jgi:hypothetical protein
MDACKSNVCLKLGLYFLTFGLYRPDTGMNGLRIGLYEGGGGKGGLAVCGSVWPRLESYFMWPDTSLRGLVADVYGQTIFLIVWTSFGLRSVSQIVGFNGPTVVCK